MPPNPGTVGALGIALLARRRAAGRRPRRRSTRAASSAARVEKKDTFVCNSTPGLRRRRQQVPHRPAHAPSWRASSSASPGAAAARSTTRARGKQKLPDLAPDPFREREELVRALVARLSRAARAAGGRAHRRVPAQGALPLLRHLPPRARASTSRSRRGADQRRAQARHRGGQRPVLRADAAVPRPRQRAWPRRGPTSSSCPMLREHPARRRTSAHAAVCPIVQAQPGHAALGPRRGARRAGSSRR